MEKAVEIRIEIDRDIFEVKIPNSLLSGYDLEQQQRLIRSTTELAHEQFKRLKEER